MLEKARRIRKKEDFTRVFRFGKPLFFTCWGCRALPNKTERNRLAFSFSKKQLPRATQRNRARRHLVAAYQAQEEGFPQGYDMIFYAARKPLNLEREQFRLFIEYLKQTLK